MKQPSSLLKFLLRSCKGMMALTVFMALLSGACNAGLIALINKAVNQFGSSARLWIAVFGVLLVGKLVTNFLSQYWLIQFFQKSIAELRQTLVSKILAVPLRQLEELGGSRLLAALTDDVNNITLALFSFPMLSVNLAILLGGAVYLAWLSPSLLLTLIAFALLGAISYRLWMATAFRSLSSAREAEDKLFAHFRALTDGVKELKLHRNRRGKFIEHLEQTTRTFQKHNVAAEARFTLAHSWVHFLFFLMIGVVLHVSSASHNIDRQVLTGYVLTALYLMGPLAGVMGNISILSRAAVSLRKVEALGLSLAANSTEECPAQQTREDEPLFEHLELFGVTHSYHSEKDDRHFTLGPINLKFHPGELVFLVGGNGSGKSTLAKIITGLYLPESGEIRLDGKPVTHQNRDDYRQLFSVVFADFYLFDTLLGLDGKNLDAQAQQYLKQLHLNHYVKVREGVFSTTSLSTGQRKRLALLTAYLEDRPFYLFDEWASDQDPLFKDIFYTQLLPELKARGKTVLVITHDDKYFDVADRLLKLDDGKLVYQKEINSEFIDPAKALPALL
jgi:putative pyoverdin transport system ATP-binding/permease protein